MLAAALQIPDISRSGISFIFFPGADAQQPNTSVQNQIRGNLPRLWVVGKGPIGVPLGVYPKRNGSSNQKCGDEPIMGHSTTLAANGVWSVTHGKANDTRF